MSRSALLSVLVAGGLAVAVSGCGPAGSSADSAKEFTGAKADVAQVVDDLQDAAQKRDGSKACKLFAPNLLQVFKTRNQTCKTVLNKNLTDADTTKMTVKSVTITGDKATAVVQSDTGKKGSGSKQTNTFTFVKSPSVANGAWQVSSFG
jgi:ketosteroid isomerase-like protein